MEAPSEFQLEAVAVANKIEEAMAGHSTVACYAALSMVIGASAARAQRPDFDGLMVLIAKAARDEFARRHDAPGSKG